MQIHSFEDGFEVGMQCPDTTPHGPHCWLLEGRIAAACPGR